MSDGPFTAYRQKLLQDATGNVLEIGIGTGLNLPYYGPAVTKLSGIDPNPGMSKILRKRTGADYPFEIECIQGDATALPYNEQTFDTVVSTWTLCSITPVHQALDEIARVLVPGGTFLFIEHGLSPDRRVGWCQHALTPIQKRIADGCHLNKPISEIFESSPLETVSIETFYMQKVPKFGGYTFMGVARKQVARLA
ncbi:MAG: class I SAM-dependent methyltransferase [Cyclonatronaceae bacterium]